MARSMRVGYTPSPTKGVIDSDRGRYHLEEITDSDYASEINVLEFPRDRDMKIEDVLRPPESAT
jgi:hypothetical protein